MQQTTALSNGNSSAIQTESSMLDEIPEKTETSEKEGDEESQDPVMKEWDKQAEKNQGEILTQYSVKVRKTWLHRAFNWLNYVTCGVATLMIVAQLITTYFFYMTPVQSVMMCYVIALCVIVILNELEYTKFISESAIFQVWITRGLFYAFIGVIAMEGTESEDPGKNASSIWRDTAFQFIDVVAYVMVAFGVLYYAMGCMCIHLIRSRVLREYEAKCADLKLAKKKEKEVASVA